jgi:hypothetical protein
MCVSRPNVDFFLRRYMHAQRTLQHAQPELYAKTLRIMAVCARECALRILRRTFVFSSHLTLYIAYKFCCCICLSLFSVKHNRHRYYYHCHYHRRLWQHMGGIGGRGKAHLLREWWNTTNMWQAVIVCVFVCVCVCVCVRVSACVYLCMYVCPCVWWQTVRRRYAMMEIAV